MQELMLRNRLREAGKDALNQLVKYTGPPFYLHVRRHKKFDNLVLFKYDQINSPISNPFIQQLRGVILDEADNWKIISRPFDKFFNVGEFNASAMDWSNLHVYEKLDGTMIQMYWYKDDWHVGTPGTPDASGLVGFNTTLTYEELFWRTWKSTGKGKVPNEHEKHLTFIFELMTPLNRIVVNYQEPKLQLLGVRNHENGEEFSPKHWPGYHPVKTFSITRKEGGTTFGPKNKADVLTQLIDSFKEINPLNQEGYVLVDTFFSRVKLKHPEYVKLHHMISHVSEKNFFDIVRKGETPEVIAYFPQFKDQFESIKKRYENLTYAISFNWYKYKDISVQKDFALAVCELSYCSVLFMLRGDKCKTSTEALAMMDIERFMGILEKFEREIKMKEPEIQESLI